MRILIAEDDPTSRCILEATLTKWEYDVVATRDGIEAWDVLKADDSPRLAILDWMMPEIDGVEVCRRVRERGSPSPPYLILLTALSQKQALVAGLEAGANDYITKPFDPAELRARVRVGERMVELQSALTNRVAELQDALAHVNTLQGILPICMHCHKIRSDDNAWQKLESYLEEHSEAKLSHGLCPECLEKYYPEYEEEVPTDAGSSP